MVDVQPGNAKLRARARRAVALATGASETAVDDAIAAAGGDTKVAIVALASGVDADQAKSRLEAARGNVRKAL
jgi:N-acetylmuramic acid 6-phosphate etherase